MTARVLVGDIGGTNARFGIWQNGSLAGSCQFPTEQFGSLAACLPHCERALGPFQAVNVAVAGPVEGRRARLTNASWEADLDAVGLPGRLLNDLEAAGWGLRTLGPESRRSLVGGGLSEAQHKAVVGIGTGLGEALALPERVLAGEGGHTLVSPVGPAERELLAWAEEDLGREVEWEDLVSGPGLGRIYRFLSRGSKAEVERQPDGLLGAWVGTQTELAEARDAIRMFWSFTGRVCRAAALRTLPQGGVAIVGGVAPRLLSSFNAESFEASYLGNGPLRWRLQRIGVDLVEHPALGLLGAGACADQLGF
jgi:glucokinase